MDTNLKDSVNNFDLKDPMFIKNSVNNFDLKDPMFIKNAVIFKLKDLCARLECPDKCTVCEAIHQLEQGFNNKWDGSTWMLLIFSLIFGGFGGKSIDLEMVSKILNESNTKEKEEKE